jgi:hypothetical protein
MTLPKYIPPETPIADGATVNAGQAYVNGDDGKVVVPTSTTIAGTFRAQIGASSLLTCNLAARFGTYPDSNRTIFEDV